MKKLNLLVFILFFSISALTFSQGNGNQFKFPDNRIGAFAAAWFKTINSQKISHLQFYLEGNEDSKMMMSLFMNHASKVGGIQPKLISYQTDENISIYSKEKKGGWVKVNLGLKSNNEISDLSIKKSYKPKDYPQRKKLTQAQSKELLKAIIQEVRGNYVIEDNRIPLSDSLTKNYEVNKYDTISQGDLFANKITNLLVKIGNDKHLQVLSPAEKEQVYARFKSSEASDNDALKKGYVTFKKIDKKIGYLDIERFASNTEQYQAFENAMKNFKDIKAIIIDLRNSGGGDGEAVSHLLSYFFDKKEFFSKSIDQNGNETEQWTKPNEYSKWLSEKPIYVLTSGKTISASEALAYFLKSKQRGTIVGETTAGAGFMVDAFELPYGFYFVNSIFSPFEYKEGKGWQGSGVKPSYKVKKKEALAKALSLIQQNEK